MVVIFDNDDGDEYDIAAAADDDDKDYNGNNESNLELLTTKEMRNLVLTHSEKKNS